ncbi:MAG: 3-oxoacyl-ACP synthase, partial [Xanthomonadales bacterium]|nr:3-oxoacyl-ACP synthase [Xanthomonadales bacterium]
MNLIYSRIAGTGSCLPDKVVTNLDLEKMIDTTDQWIRERTGICERRIVEEHQTTAFLAEQACRNAIEAAGCDPYEIDLFIIGTTTPDLIFPSTACLLQKKLGLPDCGAMDVNAACSGFLYALNVADKYIRCGDAKKVLVCGAETLSKITNWSKRDTAILFADG